MRSLGYFAWLFRRTRKVDVPAHELCAKKLSRAVQGRTLVLLILTTIPIGVGIVREWDTWVIVLASFLVFVIVGRWQSARPLPVEITHLGYKMEFTFRDRGYAEQFASLNGSSVEET